LTIMMAQFGHRTYVHLYVVPLKTQNVVNVFWNQSHIPEQTADNLPDAVFIKSIDWEQLDEFKLESRKASIQIWIPYDGQVIKEKYTLA